MKFFLTLPSCFTANNCRCFLPWTWVEVLIVVAICAVVEKKKKAARLYKSNTNACIELSGDSLGWCLCFLLLFGFLSLPSLLFFYFSSIQSHCRMCRNRASKIKALLAG